MRRAAVVWLVVASFTATAGADRVTLKDGRVFEGAAQESAGAVTITLEYGCVSFPLSDVKTIEQMPTPAEALDDQLSKIDRKDADALCRLAAWAKDHDLPRKGDELAREVIALDADHAGTRKLLGYVKVNSAWQTVAAAMVLAEGKLEAAKYSDLLTDLLPALKGVASDAKDLHRIMEIEAACRLRDGQFAKARSAYEVLADKATGAEAIRYAAIADILKANPDGMYVLSEPYPPTAKLLKEPPSIAAGPAALTRPVVLEAALRDSANAALKAGRELIDDGKKLEATDPEAAKTKYLQAETAFAKADALVPALARTYYVEITRRRIDLIARSMNAEAAKFDVCKDELGKKRLSAEAYNNLVNRMLRSLDLVRADLESMLKLASPYEQELILEVADASQRLQNVNAIRDVLAQELNAGK
jgi:hypothetical protein